MVTIPWRVSRAIVMDVIDELLLSFLGLKKSKRIHHFLPIVFLLVIVGFSERILKLPMNGFNSSLGSFDEYGKMDGEN
jgi:hypothetical protein